MDKPNIILIMSEDMGYEVPTVNGGESYETPTLDKNSKRRHAVYAVSRFATVCAVEVDDDDREIQFPQLFLLWKNV